MLGEYETVFRGWQADQGELDVLVAERDRRAREADELRESIAEIEAVQPQRGEDQELTERADRLGNLEDLRVAASQAHDILSSDSDSGDDVQGQLANARRQLDRVASHDPALAPITEALANASFAVSELSVQLSGYLASLDADGARELETVQERRATIAGLIRKYGPTLDDVVDLLDTGSARLLEIDNDDARIESLGQAVESARLSVIELGGRLSELRRDAAQRLGDQVTGGAPRRWRWPTPRSP